MDALAQSIENGAWMRGDLHSLSGCATAIPADDVSMPPLGVVELDAGLN